MSAHETEAGPVAKPYGYVSTGNVFYKTRLDAVRNGEQYVVAVYTAPQPQASAKDVALVDNENWRFSTTALAAWQRIRADYVAQGVVK